MLNFRFLTVILLEILTGTELDLYIPSFPQLQETFHLSTFAVELSLTINFVCFACFSLIAGALGDRFNRRSVILYSLVLFIVGSAICTVSPSYLVLLLGRALQGIGIAGPATLAYVIVADENPMNKQVEIMGILNGVVTLSMAGAPIAGSYITHHFGWQGNFSTLTLFGIVCFLASYITIPSKMADVSIKPNFSAYKPLLSSKSFLIILLSLSLLVIPYWMFISLSPILYMKDMSVELRHFGFYQGSLIFFFALVSIISPWFLRRFGHKACFYCGIGIMICSLINILWISIAGYMSPILITSVLILYSIGAVFPINILFPMSLDIIPNSKGRAAAVLQSARMIGSALVIQLVSILYAGKFTQIGIAILICAVISLALMLISIRNNMYRFAEN